MKAKKNIDPLMYGLAVYANPWGELQKRQAIKAELERIKRVRPQDYQETVVDLQRAAGQSSVNAALAAIAHEAGDDGCVVPPIGA